MKPNEKRNPVTAQEALRHMARICAMREYAAHDIEEKLNRMNLEENAAKQILDKLKSSKYIDDERFARSFISDKARFNKWGKVKIEFALRQKRVSQAIIDNVFSEFSDETFSDSLRQLLENKIKSVKGATEYEKKAKLIRFALNRGFTADATLKCLDNLNAEK